MKKYTRIIALTFFIAFGLSVNAQKSDKDIEDINMLAVKMFEDTNKRDFDALIEMTYPKLFEFASKEQVKELFKTTFEGNDEFTANLPNMDPKKYKLSKIFKDVKDSLTYAFVYYDMKMTMTFKNQEFDGEGKKMMKAVMAGKGIDAKFLSDNTLEMFMKDNITIVLKDKNTNYRWSIINYEADSPMMYNLLPASLLEAAKEYKQNLMLERKKKIEEESTQKN